MGTTTPWLALAKPTVNGPETENAWGVDLNSNFDKIDTWTGPLPARITALENSAADVVLEAPNDGQTYGRRSQAWAALDLTVDWAEILDVPATFPPAVHTHVIADVTGLQPALNAKAAVVHTHVVADVSGLQGTLDTLTATNTAQDSAIAGKAPTVHTHAITDVTGLQPALDVKAPLASPAFTGNPTAPTPTLGDADTSVATTAFVAQALVAVGAGIPEAPNDGQTYGRKSLTWSILDVTPAWGELSGVPATFPPSAHTHVIADVTGLQPALNAKADLASPALTGTPTAPTAAAATNTTQLATTAFVKSLAYAPLAGPVFTGDPQAPTPATADNDTSIATTAFVKAQGYALVTDLVPAGCCRLVYVNTTAVRLDPRNGNRLYINGKNEVVPSAGVTLASTGLAAATIYNIYAYMVGSTMTLEASTTARATSAIAGHQIKTGDETRTLVGKVRTAGAAAFAYDAANILVISWFNRRNLTGRASLASNLSVSTAPYTQIAALNMFFLSWGEEAAQATFTTSGQNTGGGANFAGLGFDSVSDAIAYFDGVASNSLTVSLIKLSAEGLVSVISSSGVSGAGTLVLGGSGYTMTQMMCRG